MSSPSSEPVPDDVLAMGEAVGGLLAMEAGDELALGDPGDYDEPLALDAGEGLGIALTFGVQTQDATGEWDLSDLGDLVVEEVGGNFGGTEGSSGRDDVMVMEDEWDPDAEIFAAVFQMPDGKVRVERRVRRSRSQKTALLPYGVIAVGLLVLGGIALVGVVLVVGLALLAPNETVVVPLDKADLPKVEIDRERVERAKEMSSDEILREVLGDDGKGGSEE